MDNLTIYIDPRCRINYASFHIYGLIQIFGKKNIVFNVDPFKDEIKYTKQEYNQGFCIIVKNRDESIYKKIYIDFDDSEKISPTIYDWCDTYAKINLKEEDQDKKKIISIGPNFGISVWGKIPTFYYLLKNYFKSKNYSDMGFKIMLRDYLYSVYRRRSYTKYIGSRSENDYVFALSTLWYDNLTYETTNKLRGMYIKLCKNIFKEFEGGFFYIPNKQIVQQFNKYEEYTEKYKEYLYKKRISMNSYLSKTKRSTIVFNTPSVSGCHGWKLGEYMCMGKAIISTPLSRELPSPLENNYHCIFVENEQEMKDAINNIHEDNSLRSSLEKNISDYYNTYISPTATIKLILAKSGIYL